MVSDTAYWENGKIHMFQSALRFAVVSDPSVRASLLTVMFQSALRFAAVSDLPGQLTPVCDGRSFQSALRFAVVSDEIEGEAVEE